MRASKRTFIVLLCFWALQMNRGKEVPVSEDEAQATKICQESSRNSLKESEFHPSLVTLLKMAIQQCTDADHLCEKDTYEWICLNVAGVYRRLAQHGLEGIIEEHDWLHGPRDEVPPLAAEEATLDAVFSNTHNARRFYDLAKQCSGANADVVIEKALQLEQEVASKIEGVRIEINELGKQRSKGEKRRLEELRARERAKHASQLDEAFCPAEVMDIPGVENLEFLGTEKRASGMGRGPGGGGDPI